MFDAAPGANNLSEFVNAYDAGQSLANIANSLATSATFKSIYPDLQTTNEFAVKFINNLVGSEATDAAKAWAVTQVEASLNAGTSKGQVMLDTVTALLATTSTDWTNAKAAVVNQVDVATWYSVDQNASGADFAALQAVTSAVTSDAATVATAKATPAVSGGTFTLTTGVDITTPTTGNDTFIGSLSGTNDTFNAGDSIDGGAGTDTLRVIDADGGTLDFGVATITNIETLEITDAATDVTEYKVEDVASATSVVLKSADDAQILSGMKSTVDVTLEAHTGNAVTLTYSDAAAAAGDQAANITFNGNSGGAGTDVLAAGIETVTLKITGAASTVGDLTFAAAKTVTIEADEALTMVDLNLANAATTTLNISGDSKVTATAVTADAALTAINVTGTATYASSEALDGTAALKVIATGAAALDVVVDTATHTVTGGTSSDTVNLGGTVISTGAITGGDGVDTLKISDDTATVFTTAAKAKITGFEVLEVSSAGAKAFDYSALTGLTTLNIGTATSATVTNLSTAAATAGVTVKGVQTTALTVGVKDATNPGTADTLALTLDHVTADTAVTVDAFLSTGLETLTINSTGAGTLTNTFELAAANDRLSTVTITGDSKTTITDAGDVAVEMAVNASALTNVFTATLDQNTSGQTIVGSATAVNNITGGAAIDIITGGAAADVLIGGAGADTISGAAGADTITGGDGTDTVTGGDGADTFAFAVGDNAGANGAAVADIITDFVAGTDKLQFTAFVDVVSGQQTAVQAAVTALTAGSTDAQIATAMANANTTNLGVSFAVFNGNTYVYAETAGATTTHVEAANVFVQLTGVTTLPTFAADVVA
jgi:Ca2+-binding RTX toxin-like protein